MRQKRSWASALNRATSTTVANGRIVITASARAGQRVYVASASYTTDANANTAFKDGTVYSISTTKNGTTTLTSAALFGPVTVGMFVTGTGIPANAKVTTVTDTSTIEISDAATDSLTSTLSFFGTDRFLVKCETRSATFWQEPFIPCVPIPVCDVGQAAYFTIDATTTGRLSMAYLYGP